MKTQNDFKTLETHVLRVMIAAHSAYYGRVLTESEDRDYSITIGQLRYELESRENEPGMHGINAASF